MQKQMQKQDFMWRPQRTVKKLRFRKALHKASAAIGFVLGCLALCATDNPDPNYNGYGDVISAVVVMLLAGFFILLAKILKEED